MSTSPVPSLHIDNTDAEEFSRAHSVTSAALASRTDITSPPQSPRRCRTTSEMVTLDLSVRDEFPENSENGTMEVHSSFMYTGIHEQDDIVGQYLAQRDAQRAIMEGLQAPGLHYVNGYARYTIQGHQHNYAQRWYPDPENIRQFHALYSLLSHISPERKLNALSGLEIDIIDGNTSQIFCRSVPKKMLVLFLGRKVVSKFIRTVKREDNEAWRGPPIEQQLVLPPKTTSAAAIKVLVSWMVRACKLATMCSMKPFRIPNNLFVACSLARTLELFRLHKDAYRLDIAITQQFSKRPIYVVEVETLWICLDENDRYVYGCIKALSKRMGDPQVAEDLRGLAERYPSLHARICDLALNEEYRSQFGRDWFRKLEDGNGEYLQAERSEVEFVSAAGPAGSPLIRHPGGPQTLGMPMQHVRSLNPSAQTFRPASTKMKGLVPWDGVPFLGI